MRLSFPISGLALLAALAVPGGGLHGEEKQPGQTPAVAGDSPESAFDAYRAGLARLDHGAVFDRYSPRMQVGLVFELIFSEYFMKDAEFTRLKEKYHDEKKLEADAARLKDLAKEQLTDDELATLIDRHTRDKRQYYIEGMTRLVQIERARNGALPKHQLGPLREVVREAGRARGIASETSQDRSYTRDAEGKMKERVEDVTHEIPYHFVRIDGQWKMAHPQEWEAAKKVVVQGRAPRS